MDDKQCKPAVDWGLAYLDRSFKALRAGVLNMHGVHMTKIEQQIAVCIRPKPRWIPRFLWNRIVCRVVYIEMTKPTIKV